MYSLFLRGVKVDVILTSSLGSKRDLGGSNWTSVLYFSGTFHSVSIGILELFFMAIFYFVETPMKVGG